jgi:hypothetical protein
MRSSKKDIRSAGRDRRAKARRKKRATKRVGAVRAVAKPKDREAQIAWAENLGFEALCNVTGGAARGVRGAAATHGGAIQTAGCCGWNKYIKGGGCGGGGPAITPLAGPKLA